MAASRTSASPPVVVPLPGGRVPLETLSPNRHPPAIREKVDHQVLAHKMRFRLDQLHAAEAQFPAEAERRKQKEQSFIQEHERRKQEAIQAAQQAAEAARHLAAFEAAEAKRRARFAEEAKRLQDWSNKTFGSIREDEANRICATKSIQELRALYGPLAHPPERREADGATWALWMIHRVALNDPELLELDLSNMCLPEGELECRIVPKLFSELRNSRHLTKLFLNHSNLRGGPQVATLAASLARNKSLEVLELESNCFEPRDVVCISVALATNTTLQELRLANQFMREPQDDMLADSEVLGPYVTYEESNLDSREVFESMHQALKTNRTLVKLGMFIPISQAHWRDQIYKAIVKNVDAHRKSRNRVTLQEQARLKEQQMQDYIAWKKKQAAVAQQEAAAAAALEFADKEAQDVHEPEPEQDARANEEAPPKKAAANM